jgi:hypothetical protein
MNDCPCCDVQCNSCSVYCSSSYSSGASQSQKKRLLAKAQSECMLGVATKREPGLSEYHHGDYLHHSACSKEPVLLAGSSASAVAGGYHYVTTSSAGGHVSATGQEQHIIYTGYRTCSMLKFLLSLS